MKYVNSWKGFLAVRDLAVKIALERRQSTLRQWKNLLRFPTVRIERYGERIKTPVDLTSTTMSHIRKARIETLHADDLQEVELIHKIKERMSKRHDSSTLGEAGIFLHSLIGAIATRGQK